MKRFLIFIVLTLALANISYAQNDVTTFMGIPVDGTKNEMIKQLQLKGFTIVSRGEGCLEGEFNGKDSYIYILTNRKKVYRICVVDKYASSEQQIILRFNRIIKQFSENDNYIIPFGCSIDEMLIADSERSLWYNMKYENKTYQASFSQVPNYDICFYDNLNTDEFKSQYNMTFEKTPEDLLDYNKGWLEYQGINYDDFYNNFDISIFDNTKYKFQDKDRAICFMLMCIMSIDRISRIISQKQVWISIENAQNTGEYKIYYFYDNRYNMSNGEDL